MRVERGRKVKEEEVEEGMGEKDKEEDEYEEVEEMKEEDNKEEREEEEEVSTAVGSIKCSAMQLEHSTAQLQLQLYTAVQCNEIQCIAV